MLYLWLPADDTVLVLAVRDARQAGYVIRPKNRPSVWQRSFQWPVFKSNIPATKPAVQSHQGALLTPAAAEPFMPAEGTELLENLAFDLAGEGSELSGQLHPVVRLSVAERVRSMNCYYSNLIEGHNTHPRDIDRALVADYSSDPRRRDLQLEARAHIEVQQVIDVGIGFPRPPATRAFIE